MEINGIIVAREYPEWQAAKRRRSRVLKRVNKLRVAMAVLLAATIAAFLTKTFLVVACGFAVGALIFMVVQVVWNMKSLDAYQTELAKYYWLPINRSRAELLEAAFIASELLDELKQVHAAQLIRKGLTYSLKTVTATESAWEGDLALSLYGRYILDGEHEEAAKQLALLRRLYPQIDFPG